MILTDFSSCKPKDKLYVIHNCEITMYYFVCLHPFYSNNPDKLRAIVIWDSNKMKSSILSLLKSPNISNIITTDYEEAKLELLYQCEARVNSVKSIYFDNDKLKLLKYKFNSLLK